MTDKDTHPQSKTGRSVGTVFEEELYEDDDLSPEWAEQLIHRSHIIDLKMQGTDEERREVELMRKAGIVVKALREGQQISPSHMGAHMGVDSSYTALLENGFLSLHEVYPRMRHKLASAVNVEPEIIDLMFESF